MKGFIMMPVNKYRVMSHVVVDEKDYDAVVKLNADLLEALKEVHKMINGMEITGANRKATLDWLRDIIAKAEGSAS